MNSYGVTYASSTHLYNKIFTPKITVLLDKHKPQDTGRGFLYNMVGGAFLLSA